MFSFLNSKIRQLGATNRPQDLDAAVRRRFEKRIYIPLPGKAARKTLFKLLAGEEVKMSEKLLEQLAERTEGYSGSDIATLCADAIMAPLREAMRSKHFKEKLEGERKVFVPASPGEKGVVEKGLFDFYSDPLSVRLADVEERHFLEALERSKPTVNMKELEEYEKWTKEFGVKDDVSEDFSLKEEEMDLGEDKEEEEYFSSLFPTPPSQLPKKISPPNTLELSFDRQKLVELLNDRHQFIRDKRHSQASLN